MQQTVTVPVGSVATLSVALSAGATIANTNADSSVWISNSPDVAPGNGMRLGPNGSVQWTTNKGACYARVDTGVTAPVVLSVSDDVAALNNPVDIGVAVATRLLAQGVPSVFQGNVIASGNAMPKLGTGNYSVRNLDVSRYASITVFIDTEDIAQISATFINDPADLGYNLGSFDFPITNASGGVTFTMPVTGPYLNLSQFSPVDKSTFRYMVYGSNRAVPEPRILNGWSQRFEQRLVQAAFANGTRYDAAYPFVSNGKPCTIRMVVTGSGVGKFGYRSFDESGNVTIVDIIDSATGVAGTDGKEIERDIILPPGMLQLYWYSNIAATYTIVYTLTQQT